MRKVIFNLLFTEEERMFILHALWFSSLDKPEEFNTVNEKKKIMCDNMFKELV